MSTETIDRLLSNLRISDDQGSLKLLKMNYSQIKQLERQLESRTLDKVHQISGSSLAKDLISKIGSNAFFANYTCSSEYTGIAMNAPVVGLMKVVYHRSSGKAWFSSESVLQSSLASMLSFAKKQARNGKLALFAGSVILGIFAGFFAIRVARKLRKEQKWALKAQKVDGNASESNYCIICFENQRNIVIEPCNHFALCAVCCDALFTKSCPICKKEIKNITLINVKK